MIKVLFVCLGNICRSPTAEGIFRQQVIDAGLEEKIFIDSAGTGNWHIGQPPDSRAQREAKLRGIDISSLRGRQARSADFENFDYIIAMDSSNHTNLLAIAPQGSEHKLHMCLSFAPSVGLLDVPDPYYEDGFDKVFEMIEQAGEGLLARIKSDHGL